VYHVVVSFGFDHNAWDGVPIRFHLLVS
jgi:hypothetical protein